MPDNLTGGQIIGLIAGSFVVFYLLCVLAMARRYHKVGPNRALVISGKASRRPASEGAAAVRGFRIVTGGGTFVWPVIEAMETISLEVVPVDVMIEGARTADGESLKIGIAAQCKVCSEEAEIAKAAEHLMGKGPAEVSRIYEQVLEHSVRATASEVSRQDIDAARVQFADQVKTHAAELLSKMGTELLLLTVRNVSS